MGYSFQYLTHNFLKMFITYFDSAFSPSRFHLPFSNKMPIICFPWHSQVLQPHWHEIGSLMSCAKALNASGIICIQFQMRKSLIDVLPSNSLSSALGTFMSACCISHYVVYIIFFLIWQFELLCRIFLEVKIKSGGYYLALAVASYRGMSRVGHRILQISRYQIHLFL